ncbi:hypothetical protein D3875_21230 [Deinococcus cavernae]|uniref:FAD-binding domain-containing protein n=1 Tax=Deinococcus cavernae TaxID=2320857 RepID=A0A418UZK1_9DEIO|nr:FAD-dependent monooxygenase [Deinococcus cavernae]RJF68882.1 hypothetical protein D3875_21230 [Deinococcus cavernae]
MTGKVLIVGAGIGGLTLAQCLRKRGIEFDLFEQMPPTRPEGAGLSLTINATRLLDALGFGPALRERGQVYHRARIKSDSGAVLQDLDLKALSRWGEALALHRADLRHILSQGLQPQYGREVTDVQDRGEHIEVTTGQGKALYELVVAADGLHSGVRRSQPGTPSPIYSGYTSWRYTQPDPLGLTELVEYWGSGRRLGLVPIGQGQLYVYATFNSPARVKSPTFPWHLFGAFPEEVRRVMGSMPPETRVIQTDVRELKTHVWHRPRLAFLGDAAHGLTPNLGQGAGTSIEDAVVLAECLYHHGLTPQALDAYAQVRRTRVQAIARQSRVVGRLGQLEAAPLLRLRDWVIGRTPEAAAQHNARQMMIHDAPQPPQY